METVPEDSEEEDDQDDDKEPNAKTQRLASIEASVKKVIAQLMRSGTPRAGELCRPEVLKELILDPDAHWTNKVQKRPKEEAE